MRRAKPDHTVSGGRDDASLEEDRIVRRFPRVGAQFQTRINSKSTDQTIRPAPERMSVDFPYISEREAGNRDYIQSNAPLQPSLGVVVNNDVFDSFLPNSETNRGGLLIHKPEGKGGFSTFVQPFVTSTRDQVRPIISNEAWIQHMIHLHSTGTTRKRNRSCRAGSKRKRAENEELIWSLETILDSFQKNRSGSLGAQMLGEEEATALEHLWLSFDGNIDAAEFNFLVKLSGGQATKMRKREEKERTKRKLRMPSQQTSESWRDMYQSSTFPYVQTILGQLQDDTRTPYAIETMPLQKLDGSADDHTDVNLVLEPDDSKGAWRSILACGKSIERQLNNESLGFGDKKPLLSTLLTFVAKAYALPTPESCFGTHHVMIEELSNTIISILSHVKKAQQVHAKIRDKLFKEAQDGIDSDDLLKFLDTEYSALPIRLREIDKLYRFRDAVVQWESRLLQILSVPEEFDHTKINDNLRIAEKMQQEARSHGYRSKALVQLTTRINKARDLRDRMVRWKRASAEGKMTSIKTVSAFVKEAKRIKLFSSEALEIFECHHIAEEWIDRANIAIRSKISLDEIKILIHRGEEMALDLSDYTDKLKTRVRIADDWLKALEEIVPFEKHEYKRINLWENLQASLQNGNHSGLHELSSEGNRIPVDVVAVKLLQLALDARNWTSKAMKWVPNNTDSKKGKLCDLREHLEKVSCLRDKLPLPEVERKRWKPTGEYELSSIVIAADTWIEKYKLFIVGDNRRSDRRSCLSIRKLRTIVDEGNGIFANMGNYISKLSRILIKADNWYTSHLPLLAHCGLSLESDDTKTSPKPFIEIHEMSAAVEAARLDVSLDLDEAKELRKLLEKSSNWNERVALIAPKRNKRHSKGGRSKFSLDDLINLIEEASNLPIDTEENVNRLQIQLNDVQTWRSGASEKLDNILLGFHGLKSHVEDVYGDASEYSIDRISDGCDSDEESPNEQHATQSTGEFKTDAKANGVEMENTGDKDMGCVMESILGSQKEVSFNNRGSYSVLSVFRLIKEFKEEARDISVITAEGELGDLLDAVSKWCIKSFKYLNTPREIFDKRFFGAFDRFIVEGEDLCKVSCNSSQYSSSNDGLNERLFGSWGGVVKDQLSRLAILKKEREKFEAWCKSANQILSDENKLTAEKLADLAKASRHFPANRDLVSKIRGLNGKVSKWITKTRSIFECGEKIDFQDARNLLETGEKLKVQSKELKQLRADIQAARNWSNRAKKCNMDQGSVHVSDVKQLIEEHHCLLIEMPDELEILKQATIGYCICRRPYDGFMIGCDHCEEWYHGSCIGISESKADRVEKFTCVRCSTKKIFNSSTTTAVGIIKKWTCSKDLKKARQIEHQKLQRKDRKERKDIEKFSSLIKQLEDQMSDLKRNDKCTKENEPVMEFETMPASDIIFGCDSNGKKAGNRTEHSDDPSANIVSVENSDSTTLSNDGCLLTSDEKSTANIAKSCEITVPKVQKEISESKPTKATPCPSDNDFSRINTNGIPASIFNEAELLSKLDKANSSLKLSRGRLEKISYQSHQKTLNEAKENQCSNSLRKWCLQVRSEVLAPSVEALSEKSRPTASGMMPLVMKQIITDAEHLGIIGLLDVKKMIDCLKSLCWSFSAMAILRRKPSDLELRRLVSEASKFKLPDEKALRTIKFMTNRASQLQSKIQKALSTKKGGSKLNLTALRELESGVRVLPVIVSEEEILRGIIQNKGVYPLALEKNGKEINNPQCLKNGFKEDISPHAQDPNKLWPPVGLLQSQAAMEAFGSECLSIPDSAVATPHRSEVVGVGSLTSQLQTPKEMTASSETQGQDKDTFTIDKSCNVSGLIREFSPKGAVDNESCPLGNGARSLCTLKKVSPEVKQERDKIPDNPKVENVIPDPIINQPSCVLSTKIQHEEDRLHVDLSTQASNSSCLPREQLKDEGRSDSDNGRMVLSLP